MVATHTIRCSAGWVQKPPLLETVDVVCEAPHEEFRMVFNAEMKRPEYPVYGLLSDPHHDEGSRRMNEYSLVAPTS